MKIYVVTHKEIDQKNSRIRQKIKVGTPISNLEYINDNTGDNISKKNPYYCELTALYWIWKNSKEDIVGLEHYRRQFVSKISINGYKLLSEKDINKYLKKFDIIIPYYKKTSQIVIDNYYRGEQINNHVASDIDCIESIIQEYFPDEYGDFYNYLHGNSLTTSYNMFICNKKIIDKYCEWLFKIFDIGEAKIDFKNRTGNQRRLFGYLSERLFGYWIQKNNLKVKGCPVIFLESFLKQPKSKRIKMVFNFYKQKIQFKLKGYLKVKY